MTMTWLLPDINAWLALAFAAYKHHIAARTWFDGLTTEVCFFCRLTQQGFLRLATNARVFPDDAVTLPAAWAIYDALVADPRVSVADEPVGRDARWRAYAQCEVFTLNAWNDAFLAAFAQAADCRPMAGSWPSSRRCFSAALPGSSH
jgi:uncharacterized protein